MGMSVEYGKAAGCYASRSSFEGQRIASRIGLMSSLFTFDSLENLNADSDLVSYPEGVNEIGVRGKIACAVASGQSSGFA
jgi:hypothetical protein